MNAGSKPLLVSAQLTVHMQRGALEVLCDLRELIHNQSEVLHQSIANRFQFYQLSPKTDQTNLSIAISTAPLLDKPENSTNFSIGAKEARSTQRRIHRNYSWFRLFYFCAFGASEVICLMGVL